MPRGKNCRETIFAAQLPRDYPHHGGNFERGKNVLSCGGEAIWKAFSERIWARAIESQKLPRDSGESIFAARHQDVSQGPLGVKTCAVRPVFAPVVGELRAANPSRCPRAHEANAGPVTQSEAPRQRWKPGRGQHSRPKNQDSQHMLNQPRGSFPDSAKKKAHQLLTHQLFEKAVNPGTQNVYVCAFRLPSHQLLQNAPS